MLDEIVQKNRSHKKVVKGRGGKEKKILENEKKKGTQKHRHNARAFSVAKIGKTQRILQRNLDRGQKKEYAPAQNRRSQHVHTTPPVCVVVMGPKGVGKSTLIRSLVKHHSKQTIMDPIGPITLRTSKTQRITLLECPCDTNAMIDCSKIADLVLLVVDAKFGYEMETFEFLNMCQVHGFPKVVGVLTHLDQFRTNKQLNKQKKILKNRFWTEVYDGAKVMFLSGVLYNKWYLKTEIQRLSLLISRLKYRPLIWRNTHPYVLVDRHEDVTEEQDKLSTDRNVSFYGYIRGSNLRHNHRVHLLGVGDFDVAEVDICAHPCPLPNLENPSEKRLSLTRKKGIVYAPRSNIGAVSFDRDAVYIDINQVNYTKPEFLDTNHLQDDLALDLAEEPDMNEPAGLLKHLQDVDEDLKQKISMSEFKIFQSSNPITMPITESDDEDLEKNDPCLEKQVPWKVRNQQHSNESDSSDDDMSTTSDKHTSNSSSSNEESSSSDQESSNDLVLGWKSNLTERATSSYLSRELSHLNLQNLIYGNTNESDNMEENEDDDSLNDDFFKIKTKDNLSVNSPQIKKSGNNLQLWDGDSSRMAYGPSSGADLKIWLEESHIESIRDKFVTGNWGDNNNEVIDDDEYDTFEDLETNETFQLPPKTEEQELQREYHANLKSQQLSQKKEEKKDEDEDEDEHLENLKREKDQQLQRNFSEFGQDGEHVKIRHEGYGQGYYCRILLKAIPTQFLSSFRPNMPLIFG